MRTLVCWCPDWPLVAAGHGAEERAAVLAGGRVLAASAAARALGVRAGQRRRDAEAHCGDLLLLERDPRREAQCFEPVLRAIGALTPELEVTRPGLCALLTRGPARYHGGEAALVAEVRARAEQALVAGEVRVGVADGRFAAMLAARQNLVVAVGENRAFLGAHPITALGRSGLVEVLAALGIATLGELAALSEQLVIARFGREGERAFRLASGVDEEHLHTIACPPELALVAELDPPAERVEEVAFRTRQLAEGFLAAIGQSGLSCERFVIELETDTGDSSSRLWRATPPLRAEAIIERLRWQLEGWLNQPGAKGAPHGGLSRVSLRAAELVAAIGVQLDLYAPTREGEARARRTLDRLSGLLGLEAVCTAVLTGGRGPAERFARYPWGEEAPAAPGAGPWPGHHRLPAPAWVYPEPLYASLFDPAGCSVSVSGRGALSAAPAALVIIGDRPRPVTGFAGPWLYDEAWWTPRARRRARLQVACADASAHLCFLERGHWWVEATYD